jgi:hypothetical protein
MTTSMITKICTTCSALAAVAVLAAPSQAQTSCNTQTIKGAYASVANEWIGKTTPYTVLAAVRHTLFDGVGNFKSDGYLSNSGTIAYFTLDGTYTVAADCTMTATGVAVINGVVGTPATFFGVIAADSNKIYQIRTDANTETIIFERVVSNQNTQ